MNKDLVAIRFLNTERLEVVEAWMADVYEKYGVAERVEHF
jgi:hypothetical protein